ncbi:MAG: hypothetical protein V3T64_15485 [Myxococcota bacterium]
MIALLQLRQLLAGTLLVGIATTSTDDLAQSLSEARRTYDLDAAVELRVVVGESLQTSPSPKLVRLLADVCLLEAELRRIEFESLHEAQRAERRELGALIDEAAGEGLARLAALTELDSDGLRLQADLLGTLIRSKFRGRKYRRDMESAAQRALDLDPRNALALVSLAKPYVFHPGRSEDDLRIGLEFLDRALVIDSGLESALLLRGRAFAEIGKVDEAIADWQRALDRNPDCEPARSLLEQYGGP